MNQPIAHWCKVCANGARFLIRNCKTETMMMQGRIKTGMLAGTFFARWRTLFFFNEWIKLHSLLLHVYVPTPLATWEPPLLLFAQLSLTTTRARCNNNVLVSSTPQPCLMPPQLSTTLRNTSSPSPSTMEVLEHTQRERILMNSLYSVLKNKC